ncbi:hypothetical protein GIB67_030690 [Kingdonia uniflora]|uniref:Uncharacterized protein n=1 Tax=Kingdonia uniflora TaxID=39325 RepID=A0A7J7NIJ6_9MAGN|nr:hypothetical protein GIB67_030690 [Kingdonia uniflora]
MWFRKMLLDSFKLTDWRRLTFSNGTESGKPTSLGRQVQWQYFVHKFPKLLRLGRDEVMEKHFNSQSVICHSFVLDADIELIEYGKSYGNTSSPVPPRVLDDTSQRHQDTGHVVAMSVQEGLSSQALAQLPRREIEEYNSVAFEQLRVEDKGLSKRQIAQGTRRENEARKRKVVPVYREQTSNQLTSVARNTDIDFNQVAPYTGISFPTTPIRKTPQDGNASSTVPPRELDDIAQCHQDTGPKVAMLEQEGPSSQVLAQRPRRKFDENNFVAFDRLPVQDEGLSKRQIAQRARRENDGNIDFNRVASCTAISFPTAPIPKTPLETALIPQDIPISESRRQICQRARRERERQLKGDAIICGVSQRAKVVRNLDVDFNQASICTGISVPTTPTVPSPVPVANDNVFSTEEDLLSNVIPIPPLSHTHETDNFPSIRSFKIGDTSRTRVNMFNVDFNDQSASSEDENHQRNDIRGVGLQMGRHFLVQMDVRCIHCDEKLSQSSILNPRFGQCCFQGKIRLPTLDPLPTELQELYDGNGIL